MSAVIGVGNTTEWLGESGLRLAEVRIQYTALLATHVLAIRISAAKERRGESLRIEGATSDLLRQNLLTPDANHVAEHEAVAVFFTRVVSQAFPNENV